MNHYRLLLALPLLVLAFACARLSQAGSLEAAGRLDEARERARSAKVPATMALWLLLFQMIGPADFTPTRLAASAFAAGAAVVALLAALSRKPRPSVWFAGGLLAASVVALILLR